MEFFCFYTGIVFAYLHHPLALLIGLSLVFIQCHWRPVIFMLLGCTWAMIHEQIYNPELPNVDIIPTAQVTGTVATIPNVKPYKTQFIFSIENIDGQKAQGLIQLAWYQNPKPIQAGDRLSCILNLKKPRNYNNPGSQNYAGFLASRHIYWTGYVKKSCVLLKRTNKKPFFWEQLRSKILKQLVKVAPNEDTAGILEALSINTTSHIKSEQWELFRRTGTIHLFGISGEHISLVCGLFYFLSRKLWSLSPRLCLLYPAPSAAALGGFIAACFYALLAGFAPPVQRALFGAFLFTLYKCSYQKFSMWQVWRYALYFVLLIEPHAIFYQGFYFSFLAVACLLMTQQRFAPKGIKAMLLLQLSCLIGLMPLTLYWYAYGSVNGFIANLLCIPLVSFVVLPLCLLTLLSAFLPLGPYVAILLSYFVSLLYQLLRWTEHLAFLNISWFMDYISQALLWMLGLALLVLLPARPFRLIAALCLVMPFFPQVAAIKMGNVLVRVLDVGQGLSIAIHTQNHHLLFDTGDKFFHGSDLGQLVIIPYLHSQKIKALDALIISHPDKDHRGGLESIEQQFPIASFIVNDPKYYHRGLPCHQIKPWTWDGVLFQFLAIDKHYKNRNNNSCILQIKTKDFSYLLTGDIEKEAEEYLVAHYASQLASNVLVLAHHGSKTSSSAQFLKTIEPSYALASLGFANRYHFPHEQTLSTLNYLKIPLFRSDECGMIEVNSETKKPICFRQ